MAYMHILLVLVRRVEVAENRKRGDVGTKQREGQAAQDMARIEAANQKAQNEQRAAIAQSNRDLEMIRWGAASSYASSRIAVACAAPRKESPCEHRHTCMHVLVSSAWLALQGEVSKRTDSLGSEQDCWLAGSSATSRSTSSGRRPATRPSRAPRSCRPS